MTNSELFLGFRDEFTIHLSWKLLQTYCKWLTVTAHGELVT